ncbi:MAG: ABC transporter permease [Acetobacteraceae bacterium]|nr:ABC transporter permease [Acetobacteraceae bacterium]
MGHDWRDFSRNPTLWVMVGIPVLLSYLIVRATAAGAPRHLVAPMWVLFAQVMVGVMLSAPDLAEERERRTVEALVVSTASYREVVAAKWAFAFLVSLAVQALVLTVNQAWTGGTAALIATAALSGAVFTLVGLLIGLCCGSVRLAGAAASAIMVALFLTGGIFESFGVLKPALRYLPSVLSVRLLGQAMAGTGLQSLDLLCLVGWLAALAAASLVRIEAELRR